MPEPNEAELWKLLEEVERERDLALSRGYYPLDVAHAMKQAKEFLLKYRSTKGWDKGYEGRAAHYDAGFCEEDEKLLLHARESLLGAKGALIALKLPSWAKELRYYYLDRIWGEESIEAMDPRRGVAFLSGSEWSLSGFPESQANMWNRCHCRPTAEGIKLIEKFHTEGKRVGTYMSGGMMPITFALLPDAEEDWTDDFMGEYAGHYWHGRRERFWGARAQSSQWRGSEIPHLGFSRWMMRHLEFAQRIGFNFVHLDEAFGEYPEARTLSEKNPDFVMCPNNLARMYLDEPGWRFGWTAMGEHLGNPSEWDEFNRRMRKRSMMARNIPWWGWHTYTPFERAYQDLTLATSLANKGTDVAHSNPSNEYVEFTRRFSDYVFGSYVDIYVPQDVAKAKSAPKSLRMIVNRRVLGRGREELIVHLLNVDPKVASVRGVSLLIGLSGFAVRTPPAATFLSPELGAVPLEAKIIDGAAIVTVPEFRTWGIVVVGEGVFPRVDLLLKSRDGVPIVNPLDRAFVPGQEIEIEARVKEHVPARYSLGLHLPEGWKLTELGGEGTSRVYRILPLFAEKGRGYAITPMIEKDGELMPSWPLVLQAEDPVSFRLLPPMVESPRVASEHQLEIRNYGRARRLRFSVKVPEGWKVDVPESEVELGAGETTALNVRLLPSDHHLKLWEFTDVEVAVDWEHAGLRGRSMMKIRVFPARFVVYSKGVERMIMHSYPNLYFIDDFEEAKARLKGGEYVALWLVSQDPREYGPIVDEFLSMGGGVVWAGEPFEGANCPVLLQRKGLTAKLLRYHGTSGEAEETLLLPAVRKRSVCESETAFVVFKVKAKEWGRIAATWSNPPSQEKDSIEGTPAVVISTDADRRIAYVGSDLEATSEAFYRFEDRNHHESHWFQTYAFYLLLSWASGAYGPGYSQT